MDALLSTTRAVRKRLDLTRPVEREVILECLRLAVQAPTGGDSQDWRWVVVTDAGKRAAIAEIYNSVGAEYLARKASTATDPQARRVYESATALTSTLADVPVYVIPCIERRMEDLPLVAAASAWGSILPAAWSFSAGAAISRARISLDHTAFGQGARGCRAARNPRRRHASGLVPGGLHGRHRLQAGTASAGRGDHLLEHVGRTLTGQAIAPVGI